MSGHKVRAESRDKLQIIKSMAARGEFDIFLVFMFEYGKTRKQTECDGPTGYTMHLLDDIVDKMIREIFRRMKGISKKDLIQARYAKELNLRKSHMAEVKAELSKATEGLNVLRAEIVRCIQGESAFSQDTLAGLIRDAETKCSELQTQYEEAEAAVLTVRSC